MSPTPRHHAWKHHNADPGHVDRCACGSERRLRNESHYEFRASATAEWVTKATTCDRAATPPRTQWRKPGVAG